MQIDNETIQRIAYLARLGINEQQIPQYRDDLNKVLELVKQIQSIDTTGVKPLAHPLDTAQRLRADRVTETNQRELFQRIAPQVTAGLYLVPAVIDQKEG
ncbi:MAG: Asp-tRNA(Asn)/Glu-tRNA(Gln) amidotransferase subunit GatC [Gammaproteobacteria bacterium]